jgi:hypothetical protein
VQAGISQYAANAFVLRLERERGWQNVNATWCARPASANLLRNDPSHLQALV